MSAFLHTVPGLLLASLLLTTPALADPTSAAPDDAAKPAATTLIAATSPEAAADPQLDVATPSVPTVESTARDWAKTVHISYGLGASPQGNREGDLKLRLVTRGDTGKVAALKVGLLALAVMGGGNVNGFSKKNLRGETIDTVPSPAMADMPALLRARLATYFADHPDTIPYDVQQVRASARQWSLTYKQLSGSDIPYELQHEAAIGFVLSGGLVSHTVNCVDTPRTATLTEWQADDYAMVRAASQELAEQCVASFAAKLPDVFPELAAPAADMPVEPPLAETILSTAEQA